MYIYIGEDKSLEILIVESMKIIVTIYKIVSILLYIIFIYYVIFNILKYYGFIYILIGIKNHLYRKN